MDTYDLKTPDSYAMHLAQLDTSDAVIASSDILNEDGLLLVKKGYSIKSDTVKRLLNHKLVQPLEMSVSVKNAIGAQRLFDDIMALLRSDKESQAIHQAFDFDKTLYRQCEAYARKSLLMQKITVLSSRLDIEYRKALFCAWFSMALATQMDWGDAQVEDAFIAGLVHDTGLLHIDPAIVKKEGEYTPEEWRALQSHSLIADMFLSYVDGLSPNVRRAVREHHERCDGTGYPAALFSDKLCTLGQLIAMADTVWAISKKPCGRKAHTLTEVMSIIKMNTEQHPEDVHSALYHLYQGAGLYTRTPTIKPTPDLGDRLVKTAQQLQQRFRLADQLRASLPEPSTADKTLRSAHSKLKRLWFVVNGSGLLTEATEQWLERVKQKEQEAAAYDMHEMSLMYGELQWQLAQLNRLLQLILNRSHALDVKLCTKIQTVVDALGQPLDLDNSTPLNIEVA